MPTPNVELARQTLEYIEAHPELWDQGNWARKTECGTAFCFAGHAVALADPTAEFDWFGALGEYAEARAVRLADGQLQSIRVLAHKLLRLNTYSCDVLFEGTNTLEHLQEYVRQLSDPLFTSEDDLVCVNLHAEQDEYEQDDDEYDFEGY